MLDSHDYTGNGYLQICSKSVSVCKVQMTQEGEKIIPMFSNHKVRIVVHLVKTLHALFEYIPNIVN